MISRRVVLAGGVSAAIAQISSQASGQEVETVVGDFPADLNAPIFTNEPLNYRFALPDPNAQITYDMFLSGRPYGTEPPFEVERKIARHIMDAVPTSRAYAIAEYLDSIGRGIPPAALLKRLRSDALQTTEAELSTYVSAWPVRWNPLIVEFFTATQTPPSNDEVPWCAAFLSWTLSKSAQSANLALPSRGSASSGWFRDWSQKAGGSLINIRNGETPRLGDIVVFADNDGSSRGHVGFYVGHNDSAQTIRCLGGNQIERSNGKRVHRVSMANFRMNGSKMALHSIHSHAALH